MVVVERYVRKGFSLVEMMVVIAIIGIITALIGPGINRAYKSVQKSSTVTTMRSIKTGITRYQQNIHQWPTALKDLIKKPNQDMKKWEGPYIGEEDIKEVPVDAWDGKFVYKLTPGTQRPYELFSYGPEGKGSPKEEWINVWDE